MSNVILLHNGVDRSEYFKGKLRVSPGGDGVVGGATIYLDQEAGGLDIRPMDEFKIYIPHNTTTNAGIAAKGRLFGGHALKRQTSNIGTTKTWAMPLADYNIILKRHRRRPATAYAVNISADTLDQQIIELFGILQGAAPSVQLDVVTGVALTTACPAVSFPGGHTWEWYLQQLLIAAHTADPAVFPAYYMAPDTTFGALEVFGPPKLNVYDAASPPSSSMTFSDTPSGGEKEVFEYFSRDTDATGMSQREESWWNGLVFTSTDTASQTNYPSPYEDVIAGTGHWTDGEVVNDTTSTNADEAQAAVDNRIRAKGAPRDSIKFATYERLIPGEYIDLEWSLEGIPAGTQYRIATASFEWEEPDVIYTTLTLNTRRLGLFDDGMEGFFAAPVEGDDIPPVAPADLDVTRNVYNTITGKADLTFAIDNTGASPDTTGYRIRGTVGGEYISEDVQLNLTPTLPFDPNEAYSFRVWAYDANNNISETYPAPGDPAITGTTAFPSVYDVLNGGFEETNLIDSTLPRYWTRVNSGSGTSTLTTVAAEGLKAAKLTTTALGTDKGGLLSDYVVARSVTTRSNVLRVIAKANASSTPLKYVLRYYDENLAPITATTGSKTTTTTYVEYSIVVPNVATAAFMKFEFYNDAAVARDVYIDGIRFKQQTITDDLEDDVITGDKVNPTLDLAGSTVSNLIMSNGLATNATSGFLYVGNTAGEPTGTPAAQGTAVPVVFDTSGVGFYAYLSGQWLQVGGQYDIHGYYIGMPPSGGCIYQFVVSSDSTHNFFLPDVLSGSSGYASVAPSDADAIFDIQVNGFSMWEMQIRQGDNYATFTNTGASGDTLILGTDVIRIIAPSPQDSTMEDVSWTLFGHL